MKMRLEVVVVSSSPIYAEALRRWLEEGRDPIRCWEPDADWGVGTSTADSRTVVLLAPLDWREMASYLPVVGRVFRANPWLLLADLRLAGLFWSLLETRLCAVVGLGAADYQLRTAIRMLSEGTSPFPLEALRSHRRFASPPLTARELQCACGVSLGMHNRQMAELLCLCEGTVKSHIHHAMRKLELTERTELADCFQRVAAPMCEGLARLAVK